jgi:hypothetical protein
MTSTAASVLGIVLVVVGVLLVVAQLVVALRRQDQLRHMPMRSASASVGPLKLDLKTTYPGLVVIGFGIVLIVVGAIT